MKPNLITRSLCYGLGASQTVHFSVALAGFVRSQVLHLHPPLSENGFNPAAPQLNPPPAPLPFVVIVEGAGPNPAEVGLNVDPDGLSPPNENPDVVGVDKVEMGAPNWSGPGGGAGIEKPPPEPEPEEDAPGFGESQTVHFSLADAGFIKSQVPHFHPSVFVVGGLTPAAPQLNPPEPDPKTKGVEGGFGAENDRAAVGFSAPGFGVSHTVHFSVADPGFIKSQIPHFHPSAFVDGGFMPAAPQLNPPDPEFVLAAVAGVVPGEGRVVAGFGVEDEETPGFGVSHTVHFSAAEAGFIKSQVPHFHSPSCFWEGFKPTAPQLNPPFVVGAVVVVVEEVEKVVNVRVEVGRVVVLVLGPALLGLGGPTEVGERLQTSPVGMSSSANPLTSLSALNSPGFLPPLIVLLGSVKVSVGSSRMAIERTIALASLGEVTAVGDTEDAEEAVSSLSALILNRNFEGSLGADDLRPKKGLPPVVGEIVGEDDGEVPLRPVVCN